MRAVLACLPLLLSSAVAVSVPFTGWTTQDEWTAGAQTGVCLVREELHQQDFPALATQEEALKFAQRLQQALMARKLAGVVTQPVERPGQWGVLAAYVYTQGGERYKVTQLYLSNAGKLRTFTGSARDGERDQCVNDMLSFVRYLAN